MEGFDTDVQALLRDLTDNHGATFNDDSSLAHSQRSHFELRLLDANRTLKPPFESSHQSLEDVGLDAYDRALLAEPLPQPRWQSIPGFNGASAGRLSLPGHTAPSLLTDSSQRRPSQRRAGPNTIRPQMDHYAQTPPAQRNLSSPLNGSNSSPSLKMRQRHTDTPSQHFVVESEQSLTPYRLSSKPLRGHKTLRNVDVAEHRVLPPFITHSTSQRGVEPQRGPNHAHTTSQDTRQPDVQRHLELNHAPPIVQGVQLVSLDRLPDRLRSVFQHPLFNAIQSKCFATAYESSDNLVVSAPTGGGKTAILELAICRLVAGFQTNQYKIVYMAPTKSLCSERHRDWQAKFAALDLLCAELTGDTEHGQLRNVQSASIIITTPEKWDSMTRKWKDHAKLMQMVKLFLIDEVHMLKDTRGATLEAVVSRMKSVGSNVRFVALSATVPNSEDIAAWLGKNAREPHLPAPREKFGEEFRPVKLQKHVVGLPYTGNDFGFEGACEPKLPDILAKYSHKKPIMVFCITRNATISTAKLLANIWASRGPQDRYWAGPTQRIAVQDPELKNTLPSGVAFHHAGLEGYDRHAVEKGFLEGQINVICCTSTLAVGVNLPCHMVIIKNTMNFTDDGLKEYADLEIMQMLGRAGRPQFDTTAVAVIITKQEKAKKYERLVSGEQLLESCLHLNLIDHLNAEIGLGTIYDLHTAKRWLTGTFLYIRLGKNPQHYKLDGDAMAQNLDDRIERICKRDLALLEGSGLVLSTDAKLRSTELGDAMARYYVQFKTMQVLLELGPRAKMSDILSALVQANEFQEIRLKATEKKLFKTLNGSNGIKYPIKVDIAMPAHKRSLIVQAELGGVEFPTHETFAKLRQQYNTDKNIIFSHIQRLIHCVIDCQIYLLDAVAVRHALELCRSLTAKVWDNTPHEMRQFPQIGLVAIRKLTLGGINSIEALDSAEPHKIEMLLSKNPPFGQTLLEKLKDFPRLRVSVKLMGKEFKDGRPVTVKLKVECGLMNDRAPATFDKRPIYVYLLSERSDGHLIDCRRLSARNLTSSQDILMSAELLNHMQYITCYVMCEAVAGTLRFAELKPDLPAHSFPRPGAIELRQQQRKQSQMKPIGKMLARSPDTSPATLENDEFPGDEINDQDLVDAAEEMDFNHIDHMNTVSNGRRLNPDLQVAMDTSSQQTVWNPKKLENGKWACNHKCKDKTACKHLCCRDGVDKAPKPPKDTFVSAARLVDDTTLFKSNGMAKYSLPRKVVPSKASAQRETGDIETVDLAGQADNYKAQKKKPRNLQNLQRLHEKVVKDSVDLSALNSRQLRDYTEGGEQPKLPGPRKSKIKADSVHKLRTGYENEKIGELPSSPAMLATTSGQDKSTDYGGSWFDDLPSPSALLHEKDAVAKRHCDTDVPEDFDLSQLSNGDEKNDMEAALVGLSDSIAMNEDVRPLDESRNVEEDFAAHDPWYAEDHGDLSATPPTAKSKVWGASASSKLFLSTDSIEEAMEAAPKRKAALTAEAQELYVSAPVPKRPKLDMSSKSVIPKSTIAENDAAAAAPVIKPGQPAWVYEFDPGFIAEWQDIVDFV